jgi:hypothetical protein
MHRDEPILNGEWAKLRIPWARATPARICLIGRNGPPLFRMVPSCTGRAARAASMHLYCNLPRGELTYVNAAGSAGLGRDCDRGAVTAGAPCAKRVGRWTIAGFSRTPSTPCGRKSVIACSPTSSESPAVSPAVYPMTIRQPARDHHLVLQRLSGHGPASGNDHRRHAGHRGPDSASAPAARAIFRAPIARWSSSSARSPTCTARKRAGLYLGLRVERSGDLDHCPAAARLRDLLGPAQPCLDDPGRAPVGHGKEDLPPQRRGASARAAGLGRSQAPQADLLRVGLLDGWRHRADQGDLRPGRGVRRAHLYR